VCLISYTDPKSEELSLHGGLLPKIEHFDKRVVKANAKIKPITFVFSECSLSNVPCFFVQHVLYKCTLVLLLLPKLLVDHAGNTFIYTVHSIQEKMGHV